MSDLYREWLVKFGSYDEYRQYQVSAFAAGAHGQRMLSEDEFNTLRFGEEQDMAQEFATRAELSRHEVLDADTRDRLTVVSTEFREHIKQYAKLEGKVDAMAEGVQRINMKLNNGVIESLEYLKEKMAGCADEDRVRAILREEQLGNRKRGREWLAAITAVCAIATAVLGLVL